MSKFRNKSRGSAILIVILSAITFSIYTSSTYVEQQHFNIMEKKYEENIVEYYGSDNENIDEIYEQLFQINKFNQNNY
ncbi:MAG: hypothetical protein PHD15_00715 [Clostridia bacterium]|nr:hypothetical protein [Clostridia bacterium]MDD4386272.1 hypothetical protein [Clostridia bacterium]